MEQTDSQKKMIRKYLLEGNSITAKEAMNKFGCFRLASRISDLRNDGMNIGRKMVEGVSQLTGKPIRFAQYYLNKE